MTGRPEKYSDNMILAAAVPLYWDEGIVALSMNALAQKLSMPKPSIYRHFGCEDGFKSAVLQHYEDNYLHAFRQCFTSEATFAAACEEYLNLLVKGVQRHNKGCLMFQTREAAMEMGPQTNASCDDIYARLSSYVETWLTGAETRGEITIMVSMNAAVFMVLQTATLVRNAFSEGLMADEIMSLARLHLNSFITA